MTTLSSFLIMRKETEGLIPHDKVCGSDTGLMSMLLYVNSILIGHNCVIAYKPQTVKFQI
jgi:hypothetical protein